MEVNHGERLPAGLEASDVRCTLELLDFRSFSDLRPQNDFAGEARQAEPLVVEQICAPLGVSVVTVGDIVDEVIPVAAENPHDDLQVLQRGLDFLYRNEVEAG